MDVKTLVIKLGSLPGLRRRRVRIWALLVFSIVIVLGLQVLIPKFDLMPKFMVGLGPAVVLAVFLAALICEYVDSSLGMGYGTTLTPILLLSGFEPLQIVPCILLSELASGIAAVFMHQKDGNVDLLRDPQAKSTALMLSLLSIVGAVLAVTIAIQIAKDLLKVIIGVIILMAGITTLATIRRELRYRCGHIIAIGAMAAFNKGLSGGGYGPLVTSGQLVSGLPPKKAVAITSLAEALTCFVALVAYLLLQNSLDWSLAIPLTLGAVLSVPMATLTVRKLSDRIMRAGVGIVTCLLGIFTLIKLLW